ncbi:MAG: GNAT family N-acetyltransferase [Thermoplasmata archaeon]
MSAPPIVPQSTAVAPPEELLELTHGVQKELRARGETLSTEWVEQSARDLKDGTLAGWYFPLAQGGALAFYSLRPQRAYGHVHVVEREQAVLHAEQLVRQLRVSLPPTIRTIDIGFTGLTTEDERALWEALRGVPGSVSIVRNAMERPIESADVAQSPRIPTGCRMLAPRATELDALSELDWNAFRASADESLLGSDREEYRRVLSEILAGRLGRFLEEASTGLVDSENRLVAALLTGEESTRRAIFLDLMVDPGRRRQGLATFLINWGCRALWALGYASVRLWVTQTNEPAVRLYERLGFRVTATSLIYRWSRVE